MKQLPLTGDLLTKLQAAVGSTVDVSNYAVFEAKAINTNPVRKQHPLYNGGVHDRSFLLQMAQSVNTESLPLQIMHNSDNLPSGRIFYGEVLDTGAGSELRVLFWVDKGVAQSAVDLLNNGTVDQVSVSILPANACCSSCGFDFLGPKSTMDNIWNGTCDNEHVIGENGVHTVMSQLNAWFEMSLVGKGGIPGARLVSGADARLTNHRLAASGTEASMLTLTLSSDPLSPEKNTMTPAELAAFIKDLTDTKVALALKDAALATSTAQVADLTVQLTASEAKLVEDPAKVAAAALALSDNATLTKSLKDVAQLLLTGSGDVTAKVPETIAELTALVSAKTGAGFKLSLTPAAGGASQSSEDDDDLRKRRNANSARTNAAFKA